MKDSLSEMPRLKLIDKQKKSTYNTFLRFKMKKFVGTISRGLIAPIIREGG